MSALAAWSLPAWAQSDSASLVFSTSPQGQPVTVTLRQPTLRYNLKVLASKVKLKGVRVSSEPFLDGSLRSIQPKLTVDDDHSGAGKDLEIGGSRRLVLEAEFPEVGTYTTYLTPYYDGRSWPPLAITVNRVAPELDIPNIPASLLEIRGPWENERVSIPVAISEKSRQSFSLAAPELAEFVRKDGEAKFGSKVSFAVLGKDGKPFPGAASTPQSAYRIFVELANFPGAGLYEGVLRFTVAGSATTSRPFSVYVRESAWILLGCIAAGAVISLVLREYLARRRPRLVELRRASVFAEDLDATSDGKELDPRSRQLVAALRRHLGEIVHGLQLDTLAPEAASTALSVFDLKIDLLKEWLLLNQEAITAGAAAHSNLTAGLSAIATVLGDPNADLVAVKGARTDAADLWQYARQVPPSRMRSLELGIPGGPGSQSVAEGAAWTALVKKLKSVSGWLLASDLVATIALIALAGLLGMQTLWLGDLTWGGWNDWIVALLWGLGLHQTGFNGVDALRLSFAK